MDVGVFSVVGEDGWCFLVERGTEQLLLYLCGERVKKEGKRIRYETKEVAREEEVQDCGVSWWSVSLRVYDGHLVLEVLCQLLGGLQEFQAVPDLLV